MKNVVESIKSLIVHLWELGGEMLNSSSIGHDPFKGHYPEEGESGKSTFYKDVDSTIAVETADIVRTPKCVIRTVITTQIIGEYKRTVNYEESNLQVVNVHGCLQLKQIAGDFHVESVPTSMFTEISTLEDNGKWCVATVFPGPAGSNVGEYLVSCGYKEGDIVSSSNIPDGYLDHVIIG